MGIDIPKLALQAARAAIGSPQGGASEHAARKGRTLRDHLPPALPFVTGAAIVAATRAAIRSRGADWLQALEERLGVGDGVQDDEDREPDIDEPAGLQAEEVEDEESPPDDGAENADDPTSEGAADGGADEGDDAAEAEPDAASAEADDAADGGPTRVIAFAPRSQMTPVRRRKLAESAARAKS